jgi:hypothetical protein
LNRPSETLDRLTRTFCADRQFFDELMAQPCGEAFVEMCVWHLWLVEYLHDIQNSLHVAGGRHGANYQLWVISMIGGVAHCLGMLMYLVARGVVNEAAASGRRALEYLGVAAHLVRDPSTAQCLTNAERQSPDFIRVFIRGERAEAERLKSNGIRYRFARMSEPMARAATQLYDLFSRFNVHGGTMNSMVSIAAEPTPHSCAFHNRSIEQSARNLVLFKPVMEITAIELIDLAGRYGTRTKRLNQAGACLTVWLDKSDPRWLQRLTDIREAFGLSPVARPN